MKKYITAILVLFLFISCSSPSQVEENEIPNGNVLITFQNLSASNLDNIIVAGIDIGTIKAKSSKLVGFDSFGFDTGMVDEDISFLVNNTEYNNHNRGFWCGTEKVRADSGQWLIKIDISESQMLIYCDDPPLITDGYINCF